MSEKIGGGIFFAGFRNSNPAGARDGFAENLFWNHSTIRRMKLMATTMLSAAIKDQYSSGLDWIEQGLTSPPTQ